MVLKTMFSIGLCLFLFLCTTSSSPIFSDETDIFVLENPCIVNVTDKNCTKCTPGSYAPYPNDSSMFYQCDNGELYPQYCQNNTVWNQTIHSCVHDETPMTTNQYDSKTVTATDSAETNTNTDLPSSPTTDLPSSPTTDLPSSVTSHLPSSPATSHPSSPTTNRPPSTPAATQSFDGASFGGGIGAGIAIAVLILLLVRCCCSSPASEGYEQHI